MDSLTLADIFSKFNFESEGNKHETKAGQVDVDDTFGLNTIPQFGQYGYEYQWLFPCMAIKCAPASGQHLNQFVNHLLPYEFIEMTDNEGNQP